MIHSLTFVGLAGAASLLLLLILLRVPDPAGAALARWLWICTLVLGLATVALTVGSAAGLLSLAALPRWLFPALDFRLWLPVGAAVAAVALLTMTRARAIEPSRSGPASFLRSPCLIPALALSVALSLFAVEIGKLAHDREMRQFFVGSGLPAWTNYAIIICELAGAAALLTRGWRAAAAVGVAALMVGAIAVHAHNGDPFSDSLEAVHILIILLAILLLRWSVPGHGAGARDVAPE